MLRHLIAVPTLAPFPTSSFLVHLSLLQPLLEMFGSSEDRARQLAGRHRRDRKASGSSYTGSRSVSASMPSPALHRKTHASASNNMRHSSHHSQYHPPDISHEPPNLLPRSHRLPTQLFSYEQDQFQQKNDLLKGNATMHDISGLFRDLSMHSPISSALHDSAEQFAARLRVLLVQERCQSEHMTTVLYGNPSVPNLAPQPLGLFDTGYHSGTYLPSRRIASQPQNILVPTQVVANNRNMLRDTPLPDVSRMALQAVTRPDEVQDYMVIGQNGASTDTGRPVVLPPHHHRSDSHPYLAPSNAQNPPCGGKPPRLSAWKRTVPALSYFQWDEWIHGTKDYPLWDEPITPLNSPGFGAFLNNLPTAEKTRFREVFQGNPWGSLSDTIAARKKREWYQSLSSVQQQIFKRIIQYRQTAIEQAGAHAVIDMSYRPELPAMMLHEALEAVETRYDTYIPHHYSNGVRARNPMPRSSSAPVVRRQSVLNSWRGTGDNTTDPDDPFTTYCLRFCFVASLITAIHISMLF